MKKSKGWKVYKSRRGVPYAELGVESVEQVSPNELRFTLKESLTPGKGFTITTSVPIVEGDKDEP